MLRYLDRAPSEKTHIVYYWALSGAHNVLLTLYICNWSNDIKVVLTFEQRSVIPLSLAGVLVRILP